MESHFVHWSDSEFLQPYSSYLKEVGSLKFSHIKVGSHKLHYNDGIEINYVISGTYRWHMDGKDYQLLPGEAFVTCPWQLHGSLDQILDRGVLSWLILKPRIFDKNGRLQLGEWSSLKRETQDEIGRLLAENKNPVLPKGMYLNYLYQQIHHELTVKEFGHEERINWLLDSLVLSISRAIIHRNKEQERDDSFMDKLSRSMRACFEDRINMVDMAYQFGMSPTSFNNKVKELTGLSPTDYLIDLKIRHAKSLLKRETCTITEVAMECGFYSSQHFSTTFSRRTGMTPTAYRKKLL